MKYTIKDFNRQFPDDDACLEHVFQARYGHLKEKFYRVKKLKCYSNSKGDKHIYPLKGTIFENSQTSLKDWFRTIFLFSISRNGVSALELQRYIGVTYKTAWRMANRVRLLMKNKGDMLSGIVECDETYIGGRHRKKNCLKSKSAVMGMVERKGRAVVERIDAPHNHIILNNLKKHIKKGSYLMTDEWWAYKKAPNFGFQRGAVKHYRKEYVKGDIHTNSVEGLWGQLKRSLSGTYHCVSPKYLPSYLDEFSFRYNYRNSPVPVFVQLLSRVGK